MSFISPHWVTPESVHSLVSTRAGGVSQAPYHSLNLGNHVGDRTEDVMANRAIFSKELPSEPIWLKQTHSIVVSTPQSRALNGIHEIDADACVSNIAGEVLVVMTADCLPVLFTNTQGSIIGVAHAGWRGLCAGILENTVKEMLKLDHETTAADLLVWMGPAIGPEAFEVGEDVVKAFIDSTLPVSAKAFKPIQNATGKFLADIYLLARGRLQALGINKIWGGEYCTVQDREKFFSYRRDGVTGRFASAIWIAN